MTLAVEISGRGPDLALVHGWGLGPAAWSGAASGLGNHFQVHNFALPGYAGSAAANDAGLTELADSLADSLPDNAVLCGWSLGAMIALACTARHPQRVRRLILVAANGRFVADANWPQALPEAQLDGFVRDLDVNAALALQRFSGLINHGDRREREATRSLRSCLAGGLPADLATLRAGLEILRRADVSADAIRVALPTLILHGSEDPLMPVAGAQRLSALFADAHLQLFEGSAHAPFVSHTQEFVGRLRDFGLPS
jgi:pimeloyl-[acyl-carrier protein] methyl ester esterase